MEGLMTQPRLITREDGDRIAAEVDAEMEKEKHEATRAFDRQFADYLTARAAAMSWTASDKKSNVACDKLYEVIRTVTVTPAPLRRHIGDKFEILFAEINDSNLNRHVMELLLSIRLDVAGGTLDE